MAKKELGFDTRKISAGYDPAGNKQSVSPPIYHTTAYDFRDTEHAENLFTYKEEGYLYTRVGNPTVSYFSERVKSLDGAANAVAVGSGMAAITYTLLNLATHGGTILASPFIYGGTIDSFDRLFPDLGIQIKLSRAVLDPAELDKELSQIPDVKAVYVESITNPNAYLLNLDELTAVAHKHGVPVVVDNTLATPYLYRPFEHGADIVVHSASKYLGGHSDVVAGLAVVNSKELAEKIAFIQNSTGGVLPPFDSFLLIRGIKTLGVRMDRHVENALKAADFLQNHKAVKNVYYPGLKTDPGYETNLKQAKNGGVMISFELHENYNIETFFESLKLVMLAESLGGVESLVCHPSTMTHASIPADIRAKVGITDGLIRLSTGIEDIRDILDDLDQAIAASEVK